jgi:hypothetical protein
MPLSVADGHGYVIEEQVRGKPPNLRRQIRQEQALPLLNTFEALLLYRMNDAHSACRREAAEHLEERDIECNRQRTCRPSGV